MRQPPWEWGMWFFRASVAQANAGGGAIILDFAPLQGTTMMVLEASGKNSGTNTLNMFRNDEDNNSLGFYLSVASAAATEGAIPRNFNNLASDSSSLSSIPGIFGNLTFRGGDQFTIEQTGAGAQNDTLVVQLRALLSSPVRPIVSKLRSTNQANVTIATPTVDMIR